MEIVYFTLVALILYAVSDWILNQIEIYRGSRLANRSLVFFVIITVLALTTFSLIQSFSEHSATETKQTTGTSNQK